jgi:hypothetical protein
MQLHAMLRILFAWSDEHLYSFHVHGREYGSNGARPAYIRISDLHLHCGERFQYVYDFIARGNRETGRCMAPCQHTTPRPAIPLPPTMR